MEPIKIDHDVLKKAIQSGNSFIQVGKRKFLLMEVKEVNNDDCYEVTDSGEEKRLLEALNKTNPILSNDEIKKILGS